MFQSGNYFHNPHIYPPLVVAFLIGFTGVWVLFSEKRSAASFAFFLLTTATAAWLCCYAGVYSSSVAPIALQWARVKGIIVVFLPTLVLSYTLTITDRFRRWSPLAAAAFGLSAWYAMRVAGEDTFVRGVREFPWGYYSDYGPGSFSFMFYFIASFAVSFLFLVFSLRQAESPRVRKRLGLVFAALIVGSLASTDFMAAYGLAVYPIGYLAVLGFVILSTVAIRRYHLFDITPEFAAKQITDTMSDALLVLDSEGIVRVANPAACRLLNRPEEKMIGASISSIERNFFPGEASRDYEVSLGEGEARRIVNVRTTAMRDQKRDIVAYVLIARDVTAHRRAVDTLLQKRVELARAETESEQLRLFAYAASHDLREPLNKILSFGDLLKAAAAERLDGKPRDYLDRMQAAASRMSGLIDALLRLSRVSTSDRSMEPVDLGKSVRDVLSDLEHRVAETGGMIDIGAMPTVVADRSQMYELFQNLISNALKFSRKDQPPRVVIRAERGEGVARITVEDNGIGFESAHADRIFKPFQRLHGRSEYDGHGLGLAICERIVNHHRGRIRATAEPGRGASFIIELPVEQEEALLER